MPIIAPGGRHRGERCASGDPEVGYLQRAVGADEHVLGFDIAVYDAQGVSRGQALRYLCGEIGGTLDLHRAAGLDDTGQALGQKLQGHEVRPARFAHLEYLRDVGVVDGGGQRRLAPEAVEVGAVPGQAGVKHLEGDDLTGLRVEGPEDRPLAPCGDLVQDLVPSYVTLLLHRS